MKKRKTACGFVLVRDGPAGIEYLLLTNRNRDEPGLPKGHSEADESELETALRETAEETGLTDFEVLPRFKQILRYPATRKGETYDKKVVYFLARLRSGEVVLSPEHSKAQWVPLEQAVYALPFPNLRGVVREAALWLKDSALFDMEPWTEAAADDWLTSQDHASETLVQHLRGGARIARVFAEALAGAGITISVEATAVATLLHDAGRAIGEHADHPRAGLKRLRTTSFAPYAFACVSHFTKGAPVAELVQAGVDAEMLDEVGALIDIGHLTWEERCAALADACMKQGDVVRPLARFADLRVRYDDAPVIAVQERYTEQIRAELAEAIGRDPLGLVGL